MRNNQLCGGCMCTLCVCVCTLCQILMTKEEKKLKIKQNILHKKCSVRH